MQADLCDLGTMLKPQVVCEDEDTSTGSSSDSEPGNELATFPGPSVTDLAAKTPSVFVENSSDIHIGPHLQYNGPVTVKQYITVGGTENADNAAFPLQLTEKIAHTGLSDIGSTEIQANGIDVVLQRSSDDLVENSRFSYPRKYFVLGGLTLVFFVCAVIFLVLILSTSEEPDVEYMNKIQLSCNDKDLNVLEGVTSVQWVVDVRASHAPKFTWYAPHCKKIVQHDGPSKYDVYTNQWSTKISLTIYNISVNDRGRYKLHAVNQDGEQWMYLSLNVRGTSPYENERVVVCYVAEWASRRTGRGMFTVENIDPKLCTHLIYAFAGLNTNTSSIYSITPTYDLGSSYTTSSTGAYKKMTSLRKRNPHLKVMLAMGGWDERVHKNYTIMASSPERRKIFVNSVSEFLSKHEFDGLDLHWQYPAEQWGIPADKKYFVELVKELREEFDKHGWLLTAPLGVLPDTIERSYDVPAISKFLHYMFLFCYAYHGFWDSETGANAPLYPTRLGDNFNVESSIRTLLRKGAPAEKLVLGLPLYGRTFILNNSSYSDMFGGRTVGPGPDGPYVQEHGFWGYNEICAELGKQPSNWVEHWDNVSHTPFVTKDKLFISYDNEKSLTEKVIYAARKNFAGVSVWSLDTDDFRGDCIFERSGITSYPLMRAINKALSTADFEPEEPCTVPSPQ